MKCLSSADRKFCYSQPSDESDVTLEMLGDDYIRLVSRTSGVSLVLKRVRHTYMMVLRMADDLLRRSTGLLYSGCDPDDQISRDDVIGCELAPADVHCSSIFGCFV